MSKRILIIDDEPGITAALMTRLQAIGYDVRHAINGRAGVEAAELDRPDAIILDIRMPDIDGFEVCTRIRRSSTVAETPVIFLSASVQDSARKRAEDVGGNAFLSKPYAAADIVAAIERVTDSQANLHAENATHG